MSTNHLELALRTIEREALLELLRAHPEWTLAAVLSELQRSDRRRWLLEDLTVGELLAAHLTATATPSSTVELDQAVVDAVAERRGKYVRIGELTTRLGVPRHRLWGSLRRLVAAGRVERVGVTSQTCYRLAAS